MRPTHRHSISFYSWPIKDAATPQEFEGDQDLARWRPLKKMCAAMHLICGLESFQMSNDMYIGWQVVENAVRAVRHLRSLGCKDIEFSPEDAGRSDPKFLYRVLAAVIEAGATTLNIPDTTGTQMTTCHIH